jgi:hypothetical protein
MNILSKCKAKISVIFAVVASVVTWLVLSENSPFDRFFLYHVTGRDFFGRLVFLPYVVLLLLHPTVWADLISYALIFTQWLVVGFLISLLMCRKPASN